MQPTFTHRQALDAYNRHAARNNPAYRLIVNEQARPCFFSGDIEQLGKVITISLNPAHTPQVTKGVLLV